MPTTTVETVVAEALKLSPEDRAEVIERLADSVPPVPALHPAWEAEITRRVADMDAGGSPGIPAEEAMAKLDAYIQSHRPAA
jgi:putative addiction module component (TIGR02574 family)